jgi:hypothetical protein
MEEFTYLPCNIFDLPFSQRIIKWQSQYGGCEPAGIRQFPSIMLIEKIRTGMQRQVMKERTDARCL